MGLLAELRADSCRSVVHNLCGIPTVYDRKNPKNPKIVRMDRPLDESPEIRIGLCALRKLSLDKATAGFSRPEVPSESRQCFRILNADAQLIVGASRIMSRVSEEVWFGPTPR